MATCERLKEEVRGSRNFNVSTYLEVESYSFTCIGLGIYVEYCDTSKCKQGMNVCYEPKAKFWP